MITSVPRNLFTGLATLVLCSFAFAQGSVGEPGRSGNGPNPLRNVYFGEQHLHTANSPDAFVVGTRGGWEDAYNWAMGKEITLSTTGEKIKRTTAPLDFVAITDHAEYFGVMPRLVDPKDPLSKKDFGKKMQDKSIKPTDPGSPINTILGSLITGVPMKQFTTTDLLFDTWKEYVDTANKFYKPGEFTTLIAWEWTSIPNGRNMHRNVFFRGDGPAAPFSAFDSIYPQDLWTFLEIQRNEGRDCFAIPHNGNLSNGLMFSGKRYTSGNAIDQAYASRRQRLERRSARPVWMAVRGWPAPRGLARQWARAQP
mgnify:CR=1 FL=1